MKQTINKYEFRRAFETLRPDNFSPGALGALFGFFEKCEAQTGKEMELNVNAICRDFIEATLKEFNDSYQKEFQTLEEAGEYAADNGVLVAVLADSIVYANC